MPLAGIVVTLGGVGAIAFLAWFFFGPRQAQAARVKGNVQEIEVKVKGGYQCPICGLSYQIVVDQDALATLKAALVAPKLQHSIVVQAVTRVLKQPKPKDTGNG